MSMREWLQERILAQAPRILRYIDMATVYLLLLVAGTAQHPGTYYLDTWWHLRLGQDILTHGIVFYDTLSFTAVARPFVDHQWLGNVLFYGAWRLLGPLGIPLLGTLLSIVTVGIIWAALNRMTANTVIPWIVVPGACIVLFATPYLTRPAVFGEVLLAGLVALLLAARDRPRRIYVVVVPALFLLWANLHLSWTVGLLVVGCFGIGAICEGPTGQRMAVAKKWGLLLLASLAALFVNPYTWRVPAAPVLSFLGKTGNLFQYVQEWQSPNLGPTDPWTWFVVFMLVLPWLAFLGSERRPRVRVTELLLVIALTAAGLVASRFLVSYGLVIPLVIAPHIVSSWNRLATPFLPRAGTPNRPASIVLLVQVLLIVVLPLGWGIVLVTQAGNYDWHMGLHDGTMPLEAVEYLRANPDQMHGHLLNPYEWGGFLTWWLPETPVFIDGRTDFYGGDFLAEYVEVTSLQTPWVEGDGWLASWGVDTVLWRVHSPLTEVLRLDPAWQLVWEDQTAVVFVRRPGQGQ